MVKAAKSYQQKYEKIMGESGEDELWSDIERAIAEFKKKVEMGKADGYFWNMYFNLLRSNRLMFAGINKAFITGDMAYMLNGIYQENRFNCIYGNRANSGGAQTINFIEVVLAYSCNDYKLLERIMPFEAGPASSGYSAPYYNMVYAITYHDDEVGKKAQAELSTFMEKKRTQFDLKLAKFFYDLYQKDVDGVNRGLQELCDLMGKCKWINEHIYGLDKDIQTLGKMVAIFIHGLYHIAMKFLEDSPLLDKIKMPEHKSFIKEYEEFNIEKNFPEPHNLINFDPIAKFINLSIKTEMIPEVSFSKSGRMYVNDGKRFEKRLFDNLQKSKALPFELKEEKYKLPAVYREFICKYDGLSLENGCTFYSLEELDAMNKDLQVNIYQPDTVAVGDDGGDLVFLMKQEKEAKTVYLVDAGDYDLESPYQIIPDFNKWMEKGFEIEDIDGEDVRGVDYGDLYLIKMPKEGVKGLVTIKRAFNLEMSTGELLQKSKSLPTKLLSNITSSKANIIAEKIGMPGLFEIR